MRANFIQSHNFTTLDTFYTDEIDDNLNSVETHGKCLQSRNKLRVLELCEHQSQSVDEEKYNNLNNAQESEGKVEPIWNFKPILTQEATTVVVNVGVIFNRLGLNDISLHFINKILGH